jgi:hypothetical protein
VGRHRDGERNLDEVTAHTNPTVASPPSYQPVRYLYDVSPFTKDTGQRCYNLDVRHIKLLTTGKGTGARQGVNRVLLYFDEAPVGRVLDYGNIRVACVDVRYVDGAVKSPSDGVVSLQDADFVPAARFNQDKDCRDLTSLPPPTDAGADTAPSAGVP